MLVSALGALPQKRGGDLPITWDYPTPLEKEIGLDTQTTEVILREAGLSHLRVASYTTDQKVACRVSLDREEAASPYNAPIATVELNKTWVDWVENEFEHRALPETVAASVGISRALRRGIGKAAAQNLVSHPLKEQWLPLTAFAAAESSAMTSEGPFVAGGLWATSVLALHGISILCHKRTTGSYDMRQFRQSVFPLGFQPDRLLRTGGRLAQNHLVYPLDSQQQKRYFRNAP